MYYARASGYNQSSYAFSLMSSPIISFSRKGSCQKSMKSSPKDTTFGTIVILWLAPTYFERQQAMLSPGALINCDTSHSIVLVSSTSCCTTACRCAYLFFTNDNAFSNIITVLNNLNFPALQTEYHISKVIKLFSCTLRRRCQNKGLLRA